MENRAAITGGCWQIGFPSTTFRADAPQLHADRMAGRLSRTIDKTGRWAEECRVLEDRLGYSPGFLYEDWRITADLRERRSICTMPREAHEEMAFLDVQACFDKGGLTTATAN